MFVAGFAWVVTLYIVGTNTNNARYRLAREHQAPISQLNPGAIPFHRLKDTLLLAYIPVAVTGAEAAAYGKPLIMSYLAYLAFYRIG